MPKRSNDFQLLVKVIHDAIAKVDNASVTESAMLREPDGTPREIDILLEKSIAGVKLRLAIECRDHSRKSSVEWIDGLIGKFRHLQVDKVVAVSRHGFSSTATSKAAANNIELRVLTESLTHDWSEEFIRLGVATFEFDPRLGEVNVTLEPPPEEPIPADVLVDSPDDPKLRSLGQLIGNCCRGQVMPRVKAYVEDEFLSKLPTLSALTRNWELTVPVEINRVWLTTPSGLRLRVAKLTFQVLASSSATPTSVQHLNYGNTAMASLTTLDFDDQSHNLKVVQVAGQNQLTVNIDTQRRK